MPLHLIGIDARESKTVSREPDILSNFGVMANDARYEKGSQYCDWHRELSPIYKLIRIVDENELDLC